MNYAAILVGAGGGRRLGGRNKSFLKICHKYLWEYTITPFLSCKEITDIIVVLSDEYYTSFKNSRIFRKYKASFLMKNFFVVLGGKERKYSVFNALREIAQNKNIKYVLIHDIARPFLNLQVIERVVRYLKRYPAVIPVIPVRDTLKRTKNKIVYETVRRDDFCLVHTPQGFRKDIIWESYNKFINHYKIYDDAQLVELAGIKVRCIESSILNFKITYPDDLELAKLVCKGSKCV